MHTLSALPTNKAAAYSELETSLRGLLEAQGIQVVLSAEGTSHIYGFSIFPLGAIQIIVPADELEQAQQVLDDFESGVFSSSIEDMPEE